MVKEDAMWWILMIIMAVPVSGWPADSSVIHKGQPVVHCRVLLDQDVGFVMEGPGCPRHLMPVCYQRLQEAMYVLHERVTIAREHQFQVLPLEMFAGRWDETMRDCVRMP